MRHCLVYYFWEGVDLALTIQHPTRAIPGNRGSMSWLRHNGEAGMTCARCEQAGPLTSKGEWQTLRRVPILRMMGGQKGLLGGVGFALDMARSKSSVYVGKSPTRDGRSSVVQELLNRQSRELRPHNCFEAEI